MTNSSSTSFIFFGVTFDDSASEAIFEKIVPPERRGLEETYHNIADEICDWADSLNDKDIEVHIGWESLYGQIYVKDSYCGLEGGVDNLPLEHFLNKKKKEKEWTKMIQDFCNKYGIVPSRNYDDFDNSPRWKIALEIER